MVVIIKLKYLNCEGIMLHDLLHRCDIVNVQHISLVITQQIIVLCSHYATCARGLYQYMSNICPSQYCTLKCRPFKIAYKTKLGVLQTAYAQKANMLPYIKVNTIAVKDIAQVSIKNVKCAATYSYKLKCIKIRWSNFIQ